MHDNCVKMCMKKTSHLCKNAEVRKRCKNAKMQKCKTGRHTLHHWSSMMITKMRAKIFFIYIDLRGSCRIGQKKRSMYSKVRYII